MTCQLSLFDFPASSPKVETIAPSTPRLRKGAKVLRKEKKIRTDELREIALALGSVAVEKMTPKVPVGVVEGTEIDLNSCLVDGLDLSDFDGEGSGWS